MIGRSKPKTGLGGQAPCARRVQRPRGVLVAVAMAAWSASPSTRAADEPARERVGSVWASSEGRARVRSDRPAGDALHVAWAPPPHMPDWALRQSLAAFERARFPEDGAAPSLVDAPPEPWMVDLRKPALPVRWNDRLVEYLRYFREGEQGRALMRGWLRRAGRYETRLRRILTEVGVPEDLVFVALAESGFNPRVRSRVGAAGLWQFMEATGNVYGLQQDFWVDERFDVEKSSYAAAAYLADLHARFGSWELALAAYNGGYGLVMTAIGRHNTNSFWALAKIESGLPYASVNYVPKIVAAALVGRNRETMGYGAEELTVDATVDWVEVKLPRSTRLSDLARLLQTDEGMLGEINGAFVRGRTPPERPTTVRIPRDRAEAFVAARPALEALWRDEGTVTVAHGESLGAIARRHGITEKQLRALNGIRDSAEVHGGIVLVVPSPLPDPAQTAAAAPDDVLPLAAVPALQPEPGQQLVFFETNRASTPPQLERAFGVRWSDIVRWNDLDPRARLQSGQVLQVVVPQDFDAAARTIALLPEVEHVIRGSREHIEAELGRRGKARRGYRARAGDDLEAIGKRFDLTVGDLSRINAISRGYAPAPGEVLVVYVDPSRTKGTVRAPAPRGFEDREQNRQHTPKATRTPSTPDTAAVPRGGKPLETPRSDVPPAPAPENRRPPSTPSTARIPGH
ncbi:MAG: transglycosylase SLT domain-containing protein [Nannocystaceae bacterium]